ncbi:MAG: lipid II flippase MurJ, partial [Phototrophicales bacterium]
GVIMVFAPGYEVGSASFDLAVALSRITFPYLWCIALVSLCSGILHVNHQFAASAATPILLNVALIASLFILTPWTNTPAHALAYGVLGAGFIQLFFMVWQVRRI